MHRKAISFNIAKHYLGLEIYVNVQLIHWPLHDIWTHKKAISDSKYFEKEKYQGLALW